MERHDLAPGIFTISDVLTADECQQLIALAEQRGFDTSPDETRGNDRTIVDDVDLAKRIWSRVEPHAPRMLDDWVARALNERFRIYRCVPGQRLSWRGDGTYAAADGVSLLTLMIHLNDDYEGGPTQFESSSLTGKRGMAVLFEHLHSPEGAPVTSGVEYVLRSEVGYGPSARETLADRLNILTRHWQYYETFYRESLHSEPMAAFVQRVAPLAIAENISPRSYLAWLDLRKPNRRRWVRLLCNRRGSRFGITWYKDSCRIMHTVKAMDSTRWQRLVAWLDLQD
ncbi:2OG-Fe(II) oxygenase family protein [Peristeroidobacter soli]|jgi:hypothetical protein|uniref:hypothetical protein n=1 Tax=Peristeroidobacter soli TaxID=2497877 RepID=UPI00101D686D|nr:hypothetical protein [Peristeroidobacter soli]